MAVDLETAYHIRQAFVDLGLRPPGATIEPPPLTREMIRREVRAAHAELDMWQLEISSRLTPAERFQQLCAINEFLRRAVIAIPGRMPKDLRDIGAIMTTQGDALDRDYIADWADRIGAGDVWAALLESYDSA